MRDRVRDYTILLAVTALLTLPGLGSTSLWDWDEGLNAQAAREMADADTWIIPTFNYQLRTAKPVMLYWLQRASYATFGVSEWSARLPSALCGWVAVLLTYELARMMFGRATGLLAGVVLASAAQFAVLTHAATPDAPLLVFTVLTYLAFWAGHRNGGKVWWTTTGAACGLAMLTKGPVGVAVPGLVILLYFAWNRELRRLLDHRMAWGLLAFLLVAAPWYVLVSTETHGRWPAEFFGYHNFGRFSGPMEGHAGPPWYYLVALLLMFAPWSAFLGAVAWYGVKGARRDAGGADAIPTDVRAHRLLVCWFVAYFVVFTVAATKLPNYIFPLYPALAVLTARFLVGWRDAVFAAPRWLMPVGAAGLLFIGVGTAGGLVYADRQFPGLAAWAVIGLVPAAGAAVMAWRLRLGDRGGVVSAAAVAAVGFIGLVVAFPPVVLDRHRAPRELVRATGVADPGREMRLATIEWFQPSVVFYAGREVRRLISPEDVAAFLATPTPGYLFVPAKTWERLGPAMPESASVRARHFDFLTRCEVLVVTNVPPGDVAAR